MALQVQEARHVIHRVARLQPVPEELLAEREGLRRQAQRVVDAALPDPNARQEYHVTGEPWVARAQERFVREVF